MTKLQKRILNGFLLGLIFIILGLILQFIDRSGDFKLIPAILLIVGTILFSVTGILSVIFPLEDDDQ